MSSLLKSKAFEDFICLRSEEILREDAKYQQLMQSFLEKERIITDKINTGQMLSYEDFDTFQSEVIFLMTYIKKLIYKKVFLYNIR